MKRIVLLISLLLVTIGLLAQTAIAPAQGDGSEANPYQIATWQNLYWLSQTSAVWDKDFIQTADIDLSTADPSITTWDNGAGWKPIGIIISDGNSDNVYFTGSYNGNCYTISGLYIRRPNETNVGLFKYAYTGSEIKNLGLINVYIIGNAYTAGLAGTCHQAPITNCYCTGSITGDNFTGGLIAGNYHSDISNCYSNVNISTNASEVGGLIGLNDDATITNCHSIGNVLGTKCLGGLVGSNLGTLANCYSTADVSSIEQECENIGGLIGYNTGVIRNSYFDYETVFINSYHIISTGALTNELFTAWLPSKNLDINNYLSSDNSEYLINNENDFKRILAFGQFPEFSYKLTRDIDLSSDSNFYIPYFAGSLNGNGKYISNLMIYKPYSYNIGLFGYTDKAHLSNLGLVDINILGNSCTGGLVGFNNSSTITNCYTKGTVTGVGDYTGGLVARSFNGTITQCYSSGNLTGITFNSGLVANSYNTKHY